MRRKQPRPKTKNKKPRTNPQPRFEPRGESLLSAEIIRELSAALDPNITEDDIPPKTVVLVHHVPRPQRPGCPPNKGNTLYVPSEKYGSN